MAEVNSIKLENWFKKGARSAFFKLVRLDAQTQNVNHHISVDGIHRGRPLHCHK